MTCFPHAQKSTGIARWSLKSPAPVWKIVMNAAAARPGASSRNATPFSGGSTRGAARRVFAAGGASSPPIRGIRQRLAGPRQLNPQRPRSPVLANRRGARVVGRPWVGLPETGDGRRSFSNGAFPSRPHNSASDPLYDVLEKGVSAFARFVAGRCAAVDKRRLRRGFHLRREQFVA